MASVAHVATFTAKTQSSAVLTSSRDAVWAALTDPALIARLTPYVSSIEVEGDRWIWSLTKIPVVGLSVAPRFTEVMDFQPQTRIDYHHDESRSDEMAGVEGIYVLGDHEGGGTDVEIELAVSCTLPLPGAMRSVVQAAMSRVIDHMGVVFSRNLLRHLGEG